MLLLAAAPLCARESSRLSAHDTASNDPLMRQIQRRLLRDGAVPAYAAVKDEKGQTISVPLIDPLAPLRPVDGLAPTTPTQPQAAPSKPVREADRQLRVVEKKKSWK